MAKAEIGVGDVVIDLDGTNQVILKPTPYALKTLSRQGGGIPGIIQRCLNYEFEAIIQVCQIGANITAKQMQTYDVEQKLFDLGMNKVAPLCIRYLGTLSNGGKPLADPDDEKDKGAGEEDEAPLGSS